jgi:sigma-E factor negative regulatory protein RseA
MTQPIEEQLSAFMDGELGRDETRFLLRRVERDAGSAVRWSRYHVARQALRREDIVVLRADFASSLVARLDAETATTSYRQTVLRWGSGGAIAAAVAVAALMVTKPSNPPAETAPPQVAASATPTRTIATSPAPAQVASAEVASPATGFPPSLVPNSPIPTSAASFGTDVGEPIAFDPRLQSYVIRHYQATGTTGQADFVPYILLAQPAPANEARRPENR